MESSSKEIEDGKAKNDVGKKRTIADYFKNTSSELESELEQTKRNKSSESEKGKRSVFWKHFEKIKTDIPENEKVLCNICESTISLGGRGRHANTSNLKSHLEKHHEEEFRKLTKKGK